MGYISYLSNSRVHKPQTHNNTGKLLTSLSVLPSHMTQLWAPIEQVQPSFQEFLPVAQEPQHSMAEILNRCKYSHPFSVYLVLEDSAKESGAAGTPYPKQPLQKEKIRNNKVWKKKKDVKGWLFNDLTAHCQSL